MSAPGQSEAMTRLTLPRSLGAAAAAGVVAVALAACGGGAAAAAPAARSTTSAAAAAPPATSTTSAAATSTRRVRPAPPRPARLAVSVPAAPDPGWTVTATVGGTPAAWLSRQNGVTLMRFDQRLVRLDLHAGTHDGGIAGWRYGARIASSEIHRAIAAFNGGFKLTYRDVGFAANGRVAVPLRRGLASVVTYTDGTTNIAAWGNGVPSRRRTVFSVLQNQHLLVDRGAPAATLASCVLQCWGGTVGDVAVVARSGLGITASGALVWAGGEQLSPTTLAQALISAGAVRAIELDINPFWVAGYLYPHHPGGPTPTGVVPGMRGIAGGLLRSYSRDFFVVVAR
jgi:hypothetical protein